MIARHDKYLNDKILSPKPAGEKRILGQVRLKDLVPDKVVCAGRPARAWGLGLGFRIKVKGLGLGFRV